MKKVYLILICILLTHIGYSQKLRWVSKIPRYIDLVDKSQNVYVASATYGIQDIDPGENVLNIDENISRSYFVKYTPDFQIKWVKTDNKGIDYYRYSIMCNNDNNELFVLTNVNESLSFRESDYYIAKYSQDGVKQYERKAFYLQVNDGPVDRDLFEMHTDSLSNIWISGMAAGKIAFGYNGMIEDLPNVIIYIAKYDKYGQLLKVIRRNPDKYFGGIYTKANVKIDEKGTIHQLIYENNSFYYTTNDIQGNTTKVKIFNAPLSRVTASNLILSDTCFYVLGSFKDAFDIDNSEKVKILTPKGTQDIYFAKYNRNGKMLNAWQIGGSGSIYPNENVILKNNNLVITVVSDARSLVDYSLDSIKYEVELNYQVANVCYDMRDNSLEPNTVRETSIINFSHVTDTTTTTLNYTIPIIDPSPDCKTNSVLQRIITQKNKNDYFSGDSLIVIKSNSTDTIKTHFHYSLINNLSADTIETIINQDSLTVSTSSVLLNLANTNFLIFSNVCWKVSVDNNWLTVNKNNGKGNDLILLNALPNNTTTDREGIITITGADTIIRTIKIIQQPNTDLTPINPTELSVFPNPSRNKLTFLFTNYSFEGLVEIYDVKGIKLSSQYIHKGIEEISIEDLVSGMYFLKFHLPKEYIVQKFLKM